MKRSTLAITAALGIVLLLWAVSSVRSDDVWLQAGDHLVLAHHGAGQIVLSYGYTNPPEFNAGFHHQAESHSFVAIPRHSILFLGRGFFFAGFELRSYDVSCNPAIHRAGFAGVPHWFLAWLAVTSLYCLKRRARDVPNQCPACGYDLRGTPAGVCPECGAAAEITAAGDMR